MSRFFGREEELAILKNLLQIKAASLAIIKGRRRIGKSRLLEEFGKNFKTIYTFSGLPPQTKPSVGTAQSQRDEFIRQLKLQTKKEITKGDDWGDLFWFVAQLCEQERALVILDEISWMGSEDPHFLGKLKIAWDLYFKKNDRLILAICGSDSAWIDKNILSSTGFFGRESLNLTLQELPLNECIKFWDHNKERHSAYEKLKILSVSGGVPRYLERINTTLSAEENIRQLCFDKAGILFGEFDKIFSDLFTQKNTVYKNILSCLADGIADQATISLKMGLPQNGDLSEYLDDLIKSGFISRDYTWNLVNSTVSRLSHYRLKDNYSRFYLKYILPSRSKIESGGIENISLSNLRGWDAIMGLQVENLVLSNRDLIKKILKINPSEVICDNPYFQRKTKKQEGCQIDYLIQTKYNTLYLCEIKYSKNEIDTKIIDEMNKKIKRLKIPRNFSYRIVLIHVGGLSEALKDEQYFSHAIDLSAYLI